MRKSSTMIVASLVGVLLAGPVLAQPRPFDGSGRYQDQGDGQYYYNGRWVDSGEWRRHDSERDEWARSYRGRDDYRDNYRRRHHHDDDSSAIAAGIIGFALGAAIVGSQQDAARAQGGPELGGQLRPSLPQLRPRQPHLPRQRPDAPLLLAH